MTIRVEFSNHFMHSILYRKFVGDQRVHGFDPGTGHMSRTLLKFLNAEENSTRIFGELVVLVVLLHIWIVTNALLPSETIVPAKPLIMDVALIQVPLEKPKAPAPMPVQDSAPKLSPKVSLPPKKSPPAPPPKKKQAKTKSLPRVRPTPTPSPAKKPVVQESPLSAPAPLTPQATRTPQPSSSTSSSSTAATAPKKAATPTAERFTEARYQPNYRSNPPPVYPRIARKRGWEGTVQLLIQVSPDGRPGNISVKRTSGHDALDTAAIEAARKWTFIPARRGDKPVASSVVVPIHFNLSKT